MRSALVSLLTVPLLAGCPTAPDSAASAVEECDTEVRSTFPVTGAVDAYFRGTIEFKLSAADESATIVTDIPGTQSTREDGKIIVWTPSQALTPSTLYSATLEYCGGSATIEFTTSALGTPLTDASVLLAHPYHVALTDARVTEPAAIGALLGEAGDIDILIGVSESNESTIQMLGAVGERDEANAITQDHCEQTIDFPVADFTGSPYFAIVAPAGQPTKFVIAGYEVEIMNLQLTGTFSADGTYFGGGTLAGSVDTRALDNLVDDSGAEGAICELAEPLGAPCAPCDDGGVFCLTLVADSIYAEQLTNAPPLVAQGENTTDPECIDTEE
jgi:hypothetical protein